MEAQTQLKIQVEQVEQVTQNFNQMPQRKAVGADAVDASAVDASAVDASAVDANAVDANAVDASAKVVVVN